MTLYQKTAHELQDLLAKKEVKAVEIVESVLLRSRQVEPKVHSYVTLAEEAAMETAQRVDQLRAKGENYRLWREFRLP